MLSRLKRIVLAFTAIFLAYLCYAFVAVPFIEPSIVISLAKNKDRRAAGRDRNLSRFFPPGSWELERPWVVETDQGTLLFGKYTTLPDGRLKLDRCTVICYVDAGKSESEPDGSRDRTRRPVVLRAPQGATLNFGKTLNLLRGEFGKLSGGWLDGEITITSPASEPGRDDELEIVTRNVQLDQQKIWTPHEVRFRYGGNVGRGRDLTIFLSGSTKKKGDSPNLGISGVKLMELVHLDQMQLQLNGNGLFGRGAGGSSAVPIGKSTPPLVSGDSSAPLDVSCRGPFRFDFQQRIISLEDHVDLVRHNKNGQSDQLTCQLLEIHFAEAQAVPVQVDGGAVSPPKQTFAKLGATKVVAVGYPVIIRAASAGVGARAERIEYDCILRRVWLKDQDKVMFQDQEREVIAPELHYTLGENGRLGALGASGPGRIRGSAGADAREFEVRWEGQVLMRPIDGSPVLTFTSHVHIEVANTGTFDADTLHLYLKEIPRETDPNKTKVTLDRLHALGNVVVEARALTCKVEDAKIWFTDSPASNSQDGVASDSPLASRAGDKVSSGTIFDVSNSSAAPTARRKLELRAKLVEAQVLLGRQPVADRLMARGGIVLHEEGSADEQPIVIRGESFELQDGASQHPRGALLGEPAEVNARGLSVQGERFYVYPTDNILRIVGPGTMRVPPRFAHAGEAVAGEPSQITWKQGLHFDGQLARIEGGVAVHGSQPTRTDNVRFVALGDVLQVTLSRRVDFQNPQVDGPAELGELGFDGWGFFEAEMCDAAGEKKWTEQFQVRQLNVNQVTGEIRGEGPGWLRGIHRGRDVMRTDARATPFPQIAAGQDSNALNFLRVDFDGALAGNLHRRQIEFLRGTKTLYGPVASWDQSLDEIPQSELPPQAVVLTCERLAVLQIANGGKPTDDFELEATGNAYVQGSNFSASGGRISYAQAKDQLVLEGDGRSDARLAYQKQLGARPSEINSGKIFFWPSTCQFRLVDFHGTEIYDVDQLGRRNDVVNPR